MGLRIRVRLAFGTVAILGMALSSCGSGVGLSARAEASQSVARRPLAWIDMGTRPTDDQIRAAAGKYQTVVFGGFMDQQATLLRSLDPDVKILAYMDLSSVRSYDGDQAVSTGVSYKAAEQNGWMAKDVDGDIIPWRKYEGHYQAAVWNPDYRTAWVEQAAKKAESGPWSGIFADNDMRSLRYYSDAKLAGTSSEDETDAKIDAGLNELVAAAGSAVSAEGKLFVPNVGESRMRSDVYREHGQYGGAFEEMYTSWSHYGVPDVWNWGDGGWLNLVQNTEAPVPAIDLTQSQAGDARTEVYGYATFLLGAKAGDAWGVNDGMTLPSLPPETDVDLGAPLTGMEKYGDIYVRRFEKGWVAVNPSRQSVDVKPPAGLSWASGTLVGSDLTLQPMSGVVLTGTP